MANTMLEINVRDTVEGAEATSEHFGVIDTSWWSNRAFLRVLEDYEVGLLRYPGGTFAEQRPDLYSLNHPLNTGLRFDGSPKRSMLDTFELAAGDLLDASDDIPVSVIVPTARYAEFEGSGDTAGSNHPVNESDRTLLGQFQKTVTNGSTVYGESAEWRNFLDLAATEREISPGELLLRPDFVDAQGERALWNFLEELSFGAAFTVDGHSVVPSDLTIEIGNEFHVSPQLQADPALYGAIASRFLDVVSLFRDFYGEDAVDFDVAVQSGAQVWVKQGGAEPYTINAGFANEAIIQQLSPRNLSEISEVRYHLILDGLNEVLTERSAQYYEVETLSHPAERLSQHDLVQKLVSRWESAAGRELNTYVSAWNSLNQSHWGPGTAPEKVEDIILSGDFGAAGVLSFVELFVGMVESGVDSAALWGLLGLEGNERALVFQKGGDAFDTPRASVFQVMSDALATGDDFELLRDHSGIGLVKESEVLDPVVTYGFRSAGLVNLFLIATDSVAEPHDVKLNFSAEFNVLEANRVSYVPNPDLFSGGMFDLAEADWQEIDPEARAKISQEGVISSLEVGAGSDELAVDGSNIGFRFAKSYEVVHLLLEVSQEQEAFAAAHDQPLSDSGKETTGIFLRGSVNGDLLSGGAYDDSLVGAAGNDTIKGRAGADSIAGSEGADLISGGDGPDTIGGGAGDDSLNGGSSDDVLGGGVGNETINAGPGDDSVSGGAGFDRIIAGHGQDIVGGGFGGDLVVGGDGGDSLGGGFGADSVYGGAGDDALGGGAGADSLLGGLGADFVAGGTGSDVLNGGSGSDRLAGGNGNDKMWGGEGADTFVFRRGAAEELDVIHDFDPTEDVLLIAANGSDAINLEIVPHEEGLLIRYWDMSVMLEQVQFSDWTNDAVSVV